MIPVTSEEIRFHLDNANILNGKLIETAELRAIRESLLRASMGNIVQFPTEASFLYQSLDALITAIKEKWLVSTRDDAKTFGSYLLKQVDVRSWVASAKPDE